MGKTWEHPQLGKLEYDRGRDAWTGTIGVPAFRAFTHTGDDDHVPGHCELTLEAEDDSDTPSPAAVAMALKLLAAQEKLVEALTTTLWDDFNGRGPRTGMWWHGDLSQVLENGEEEEVPPLSSASALLGWMHPTGIVVRHSGIRSDQPPLIELTCSAVFEEEHGVGILTDGERVLGTGYIYDVEPFQTD
ncbi:MAG: hypothetical protein JWN40_126 [Phycisphaerales bacterium]|nr:hypothetical protein [Phycisphaerales bacterium]